MTTPNETIRHHVYLGLGSNLGDRDAHLAEALARLGMIAIVERVSSVYDTAPLHNTDQPRFHNLVCAATTDLDPLPLLRAIKAIEREMGREQGPRYGPRIIDIDILLYDQLVLRSPELTVPHARLPERAFVLAPLAEIAPTLAHPQLGASIADLLQRAPENDVRLVGPLPPQER